MTHFQRTPWNRVGLLTLVVAVCLPLPSAFAVLGSFSIDDTSVSASSFTPTTGVPSNLGSFDISIVPGTGLLANPDALAAFERAAAQWEAFISDPITVTINADVGTLGTSTLGSASSVLLQNSYNVIAGQMALDASDESDDSIVGFLPNAANFNVTLPNGFATNGNMTATKANLKALGVTGLDGIFGASDGNITFNTTHFDFDFDNSDGVTAGFHDFESVAAHEIGHVLGFISTLDTIDFLINDGTVDETVTPFENVQPTPLDLFRFDDDGPNDPETLAEFTLFPRSLVPGNEEVLDEIFSVGEELVEGQMSTGVTQGDGRQGSHWKDFLGIGLMDPTLSTGEISLITANDLRAFDLIGFEIVSVPEASQILCGLTLVLGGFALKHRAS